MNKYVIKLRTVWFQQNSRPKRSGLVRPLGPAPCIPASHLEIELFCYYTCELRGGPRAPLSCFNPLMRRRVQRREAR